MTLVNTLTHETIEVEPDDLEYLPENGYYKEFNVRRAFLKTKKEDDTNDRS